MCVGGVTHVDVLVPRPKMSSNPAPPPPLGLEDPPTGPREDTPTAPRPPLINPPLGEEKDLSPLAVVDPKKGSLASAAAPTWL